MAAMQVGRLGGAVTGVRPRLVDRVWFGATLIPVVLEVIGRHLKLAVLLTFGLGWLVAGRPILIAVVVGIGLAIAGWYLSLEWRWQRQRWQMFLLDLPRRRRAIPGPPPGTWATDVVPTPDRYAVLLLHFSKRGAPRPPLALHVPEGVPWGLMAGVPLRRTRMIAGFEWADDEAAANAAAARLQPTPFV